MVKFKKNQMALIVIISLAILLPTLCFSFPSKTYEWGDISKPLVIDGGHKMKFGDLIAKIIITNEIDRAAKYVKLYVKYSGRNCRENNFALNVNNSDKFYKAGSTVKIKTKDLKSGQNVLRFLVRDKETGLQSSASPREWGTIRIKKLSFSE